MLDAGKGVGEDLTNGAAARPVVAARRPGKEDQGRRGTEKRESGEETEMSRRGFWRVAAAAAKFLPVTKYLV